MFFTMTSAGLMRIQHGQGLVLDLKKKKKGRNISTIITATNMYYMPGTVLGTLNVLTHLILAHFL